MAQDLFDSGGDGVFIAHDGQHVIWGFEGFATHVDGSSCTTGGGAAWGPLVSLSFRRLQPRLTMAPFLAYQWPKPPVALGVEAGVTLAFDDAAAGGARFSLHTAQYAEISLLHTFAWQQWLLSEYAGGAGLRLPPSGGLRETCTL